MHFHRRTERPARNVGESVLNAQSRVASSELTAQSQSINSALPMELKLYSREWCSWCIDAKDYLSEKGYRFHEIDVGKDRAAYEDMKRLSAQTYVPTFVAGDKVLANFDTDQLQKFLNEYEIKP